MGHLYLIRHGQASFLSSNYDKLSAIGEEQARVLGEYWAQQRLTFDVVFSGPRVRQRETARLTGERLRHSGLSWPDIKVHEAFDEFQGEAVIEKALPGLLENDADIRRLNDQFKSSTSREDQFRTFQKVFEAVISRWAAGEVPLADIEPWADFCSRVQSGLAQVSSTGARSQRVAIFTSGGPIGVAMQRALSLDTGNSLRAAWMVRNGCYCEFLFSSDRFTLSSYNASPHLTRPDLLTYR